MKYLIYISTAARPMNDNSLADLLNESRNYNALTGITGMLIYGAGTFIQALEGDDEEVDKLFLKIKFDIRHKNLIKLVEGPLEERNFPDWTMAFIAAEPKAFNELKGYINPDDGHFLPADDPHVVVHMLRTFAENNRIV